MVGAADAQHRAGVGGHPPQSLPTVQASFESKVGAMFKPKLSNHHGLSGFKSHSNYFKGGGIGGMGIAGMGGIGMAKPPAHKPLPQFQYGGGFGKPPSRGRTTSSSGIDFKVRRHRKRTSVRAPATATHDLPVSLSTTEL